MSIAIRFHRLATAEFLKARRWFAVRSLSAEAKFVLAVGAAIGRIERNPSAGSISSGDYRWIRIRKYLYVLHYEQIDPTTVVIYAVAHG